MVLYTIALKNTFAFTPRFMPRIENTYRTVLRGETKWFYLFSYLISLTTRLVSPLDLCRWLNTKNCCKYILYEIRKLLQVSVRPLKAILIQFMFYLSNLTQMFSLVNTFKCQQQTNISKRTGICGGYCSLYFHFHLAWHACMHLIN